MTPSPFEIVASILFVVTISSPSPAQGQAQVVGTFEQKVQLFRKFYSSSPKLLIKEQFSKSPTGYIYFYSKNTNAQVSYDIQKTDSIISPFVGQILVEYDDITSRQCGDFQSVSDKAFSTVESARKNKDNPDCYGAAVRGAKWIFALQKGKWVFKEVLLVYTGKPHPFLMPALGYSTGERQYISDNDFWKKLIE